MFPLNLNRHFPRIGLSMYSLPNHLAQEYTIPLVQNAEQLGNTVVIVMCIQ
jgi:hypothetical protein